MATSISLLLLLLLLFFHGTIVPSSCGPLYTEFIYPNFTASNLLYVDTTGAFLASPSAAFKAAMYNPANQQSNFYLCVLHAPTNTIVWSANSTSPLSSSGFLSLSPSGLSVSDSNHSSPTPAASAAPVWSTPRLRGVVAALRLLDTGNLLLLDRLNGTLWQSFDYPRDTFLSGQRVPAGVSLTSSVSDTDLSPGDYQMVVTPTDAVLRWKGDQQYWTLSSDLRSIINSNGEVSRMEMNSTGLFLFSGDGPSSVVVLAAYLPKAELRMGKVDTKGRFTIMSYATSMSANAVDGGFVAPVRNCDLPFSCMTLGLCTEGSDNASTCNCPARFGPMPDPNSGGCVPQPGAVLAANSCGNSSSSPLTVSYIGVGGGIEYFGNKFSKPTFSGVNFSACQSFCTGNCTCLAFYYMNSSKSCYLIRHLGSLHAGSGDDGAAGTCYVKTVPSTSTSDATPPSPSQLDVLLIVLPSIALALLLVVLAFFFIRWRRRRHSLQKTRSSAKDIRLGGGKKSWPREDDSADSDDDESISIPGLPMRFEYKELEEATSGFATQIGSGGFSEVYKGVLPDQTTVAVKRIGSVQRKREFCTEIAIIGKIHHVNLVKLRGFCAQGRRRLLVYEYMNRGSLDRSLFAAPGRPVLEWQERVDIAVGTAKGLAYLHGGCDHRIIHCDVKPENILLDDRNGVKISDFGLSKLLSAEQTSLFTTMRGTRGYLAPEWLSNAPISDRTDVYSFGMVLLEIVRGRKNCVSSAAAAAVVQRSSGEMAAGSVLTDGWTAEAEESYFPLVALEKHEEGRHEELADPRLRGRVTAEEVGKVVRIALCCLHEEPRQRPPMSAVAAMLERTMPVLEPQADLLNFLRFYGRGIMDPNSGAAAAMMGGNRGMYGRGGGNNAASVGSTGTASSSTASFSYLSSQQVSGPR